MISDLQQRISAALSRNTPQVVRPASRVCGSATAGRVPSGPRVRVYEVRETCGGVVRRSVVLVSAGGVL